MNQNHLRRAFTIEADVHSLEKIGAELTIGWQRPLVGAMLAAYAGLLQVPVAYAVSPVTQYEYDATGNRTKVIDPLNRSTVQAYDALNRTKQITDPASGITQYGFNAINQLISVTDPRSLTTSYTFNALGDLLTQASPDTGTTQSVYDSAGNLTSRTNAKGQLTTYNYDALNRLTQISYADGQVTQYGYDQGTNGQGRLTSITHNYPSGHHFAGTLTLSYSYDSRGRILSETRTLPSSSTPMGLVYAYDAAGRLSTMTYPSGRVTTYQYDAAGNLLALGTAALGGSSQTIAANMSYRPFGPHQSHVWGNGTAYTKSFDAEGRLASYPLGASNIVLGYDAASNITSKTDASNAALNQGYGYDALDRLTQQTESSTSHSWGYDSVGNRTSQTVGVSSTTYQYGALNNRLIQVGSQAITSDANGAITQDGTNTYTYDARERLVSTQNAAGTTYYLIDPLGRRLVKNNAAQSIPTTQYLYDTMGHLVVEMTGAGVTLQEHFWGNDTPLAVAVAGSAGGTAVVLDNGTTAFTTTGSWGSSNGITGFYGSDYATHGAVATPSGTIVDNTSSGFSKTGMWGTTVGGSGYQGTNFMHRIGDEGQAVETVRVDNTGTVSTVGTWPASTAVSGYWGTNFQTHAAGTGSSTFTWNATLPWAGQYEVYARWQSESNRATDAKYTVTHQSGQTTVTVNQQQNSNTWISLGTYTLGTAASVSLSDNANGYVIADVVKFVPLTGGTPSAATWTTPLTDGTYRVYAKWPLVGSASLATTAKYAVTHKDGQTTTVINQQNNGTNWVLLGIYDFIGTGTVGLTDTASGGSLVADAVRFIPLHSTDTATWTPASANTYDVYARWTSYSNRATDAKYTITSQGSAGASSKRYTMVTVNQQSNSGTWNNLGTYTLDPTKGHKIQLSSEANNNVIADAIQLVPTSQPASTYYVQADQLGTPRALTNTQNTVVWTWDGEAFGNSPANEDADGNGSSIAYNLRFPGQYYDRETNTHYNYFRDYNPGTGRYIESDPIGMDGGINTYAYVGGNPLSKVDPLGLCPWCGAAAGASGGIGGFGGLGGFGSRGVSGSGSKDDGSYGGLFPSTGSSSNSGSSSSAGSATQDVCSPDKPCPPCKTISGRIVPVGTIAFRPRDNPSRPQHGIVGPHYNILKANQIPFPKCDCFWQPIGAVPPSELPAGAIPIEPFAN
jgi:RHS repeat-associated protein